MSRFTWSWFLPQNEQWYWTLPLRLLVIPRPLCLSTTDNALLGPKFLHFRLGQDLIDETVFLGLLGIHEEVAVEVATDALGVLPCVLDQDAPDALVQAEELPRRDLHVRRLAADARGARLVHVDGGVGRGEGLARRAGGRRPRPHPALPPH